VHAKRAAMAFDVRAMENIATAPASRNDRIAAAWIVGGIIVCFGAVFPFSGMRVGPTAAFVPAVLSAAVLAQILTAILFYVQYRVARQSQLALLSLAYASSSVLTLFYMLTFPQVFTPTGLFHASVQSASWLSAFERENFGLMLIAFACADRFGWSTRRSTVRWLAAGYAVWIGVLVATAIAVPLPELTVAGVETPFFSHVILPLNVTTALVAIAFLATSGLRTVTQVWLLVVAVMYLGENLVNTVFSGARYTLGWYGGRAFVFGGASVILAVFLFKINDVVVRLAGRSTALAERTELAEHEAAEGELRYRSLANVVPQLIWTANATGEVDYVNDRWVAYTGADLHQTRRLGWHAALEDGVRSDQRTGWEESVRLGRRFGGEYRLRESSTGRARWFQVDAIPMLGEAGNIVRWIASCTDIDHSKRTEKRDAFLASAGERLSGSLDLSATLTTIADVTSAIASWSRVDLLGEGGRFPSATGALADRFAEVLSTGEPAVEHDIELVGAPGVDGKAIVVPLISGDVLLGTLTLIDVDPAYPDVEDVAIARDFGRRASLALDHARRYERERTTADSFQRAMLPYVMPHLDNVSFSASYSAASESRRIGGDFYDAFMLPNGRVALTIGDVTGHGLEAAVIMGEIRQSLRVAASFEDAPPSRILDRASRLLVASGRSVFVTAMFGVLDPRTGVFKYATAGHPSPVVYAGHTLQRLAGSGLPLGLREEDGVDFVLTLPPACTIVLYTDGLIEFARDLNEGERRLDEAILSLNGASSGAAGTIMQRVLGDDQATDDIAILTATIHSLPQRPRDEMHGWKFSSSDARTALLVRHEVGALVAAWTGDEDRRFAGELAFGEVVSNVVRHAPGPVQVRLLARPHGVELRVTDCGSGFTETSELIDAYAESGRGLQLVREIADDVAITADAGGGTTVLVRWRTLAARGENVVRS
jgi:PAS domain S-box-containing protein